MNEEDEYLSLPETPIPTSVRISNSPPSSYMLEQAETKELEQAVKSDKN